MRRPKRQRENRHIDGDWATSGGGRPGLARRERSRRVHSSAHVEPSAFGVGGARFLGVDRSSRLWLQDRDGRYLRSTPRVRGRSVAGPMPCDADCRAAAAVARRSRRTATWAGSLRQQAGRRPPPHRRRAARRQYVAHRRRGRCSGQALDPRGLSWSGSPRRPVGGAARLRRHRLRLRPAPPRRFRPDRKPVQQARGRGHLGLDDGRATAPRRGDGGRWTVVQDSSTPGRAWEGSRGTPSRRAAFPPGRR